MTPEQTERAVCLAYGEIAGLSRVLVAMAEVSERDIIWAAINEAVTKKDALLTNSRS